MWSDDHSLSVLLNSGATFIFFFKFTRHVDPSTLAFSLSSHRHSSVRGLDFFKIQLFVLHNTDTVSFPQSNSHFLRYNKQHFQYQSFIYLSFYWLIIKINLMSCEESMCWTYIIYSLNSVDTCFGDRLLCSLNNSMSRGPSPDANRGDVANATTRFLQD